MASDFGEIVESIALSRYAVDADEYTLARGCKDYRCTFSVLPERWGFLNRYDAQGVRTWQSRPLPAGQCRFPAPVLRDWGEAAQAMDLGDCEQSTDNLWLWLPGDDLVSLRVLPAVNLGNNRLQADTLIRVWLGPGQAFEPQRVRDALARQWHKQAPMQGVGYAREVAWSDQFELEPVPLPDTHDFRQAHRLAAEVWEQRSKPARPEQKALRALQTMEPVLSQLDWRTLPDSDIGKLNDVGFWLQQSQGCAERADAISILRMVVARDPGRTPVYLNLADAQAGPQETACPGLRGDQIERQENLRLYCSAQDIERIPANIARRIAEGLQVPALDAQVCRPRQALIRAVAGRDLDGLQQALQAHPEDLSFPSVDGYSALFEAVESGWFAGTEALLQAGADPDRSRIAQADDDGISPLASALHHYDLPMLELLLAYHADPDPADSRSKPLLQASGLKGPDAKPALATTMLQRLLDAGASVASLGDNGITALMKAAGSSNEASVALLLERGAPINAVDQEGHNALHATPPFTPESVRVYERLLRNGADPKQKAIGGEEPLLYLFAWPGGDHARVAEMVVLATRYGADPDAANASGNVALHQAAYSGNLAAVRALLKAGAQHCPSNHEGLTPMDYMRSGLTLLEQQEDEVCRKPASGHCKALGELRRIRKLLNCPEVAGAP